ncbi:sperm associated antigen 8 [Dicentrarchus labrax]|uniref:Sperm associated antigen 8 n=1 Tax=Dicentrarchus labrax TaxID=13489 RepID=A0A8P4G433_DICLA|nr:sperm associated antigen 8 [Dicentrarchus labrax]XP_051267661.1 sperm associated antigen 8 [Dicentrarchus labrax]XP_051267663.1 sperm associated antigen 8 [Dicentrarchus labrax]XP_051267664.1 sperm associated antigen 8 [Dicentrarchus labrax]
MTEQPATVRNKVGKCLLHNWTEERLVAALDTEETKTQIQRHGHRGILTMDQESKLENVTTFKAAYVPPKSPGVRLRGVRGELLEKHIAQMISEQIHAERTPPTPKTEFCSTTQTDFCVEGFVPLTPETTQVHDYKTDQAVTFWSENYQQIQGVTAVQTLKAPFRKSALFSTPISERLDEIDLPPDN